MKRELIRDSFHFGNKVSKLVSPAGEIMVPGIAELVAPLTPEERKRYEVSLAWLSAGHLPLEAEAILISNNTGPSCNGQGEIPFAV